jgi:undecaprenyl-diphosphatase
MNDTDASRADPPRALAPDRPLLTSAVGRALLHRDPRFWLRILIASLLTFAAGAAVAVVVALRGGWTHGLAWEIALLRSLNVRLPTALDSTVVDLPWLGTNLVFIPVLGTLCWYLWRKRRRPDIATIIAVTTVGNFVIGTVLKMAFARPRPVLWVARGEYTGASYPSGHAMAIVSVVGVLAVLIAEERRVVWPFVLWLALLIATCYSRLYLGVHWPTDILGGLLAGGVWFVGVLWARSASGSVRSSPSVGST